MCVDVVTIHCIPLKQSLMQGAGGQLLKIISQDQLDKHLTLMDNELRFSVGDAVPTWVMYSWANIYPKLIPDIV